jgi:crossover junction endodeoxyribonuclease RuvC
MHQTERRILGIDPGFGRMGYAVIAVCGSQLSVLTCDAVITSAQQAYPTRLQRLYEQLAAIIAQYQPQEAALELLFFGKNEPTAIPVAQARGVALLAFAQPGLSIAEWCVSCSICRRFHARMMPPMPLPSPFATLIKCGSRQETH